MKWIRITGAGLAAALLGLVLAACQDVPADATYAQPEKAGVYYEEPTASQECQDMEGGSECPAEPPGPVEQPERVN